MQLQEYQIRFSCESGFEYWFGEVFKKAEPTWLHSILQTLLAELLNQAGYIAGSELESRIDPDWQPRPDVAAALQIEGPYPTKPIEIVVEILSPGDDMHRVHEKCEQYVRIGIHQIFVFDPEAEKAWEWDRRLQNLERIRMMNLENGSTIQLNEAVWPELERHIRVRSKS